MAYVHEPFNPEVGRPFTRVPWDLRRDARAQPAAWKRRLDRAQVAQVRRLSADVADRFYADHEW